MARWAYPRRDAAMLEARRREAIELVASGARPAEVARRLSVSRAAVTRWRRLVRLRGRAGLRATARPGRPPRVARSARADLPRILSHGPEAFGLPAGAWTLHAVAEATARVWGVRYGRGAVWRLLRQSGFVWHPFRRSDRSARTTDVTASSQGGWVPGLRIPRPRRTERLNGPTTR